MLQGQLFKERLTEDDEYLARVPYIGIVGSLMHAMVNTSPYIGRLFFLRYKMASFRLFFS